MDDFHKDNELSMFLIVRLKSNCNNNILKASMNDIFIVHMFLMNIFIILAFQGCTML